MSKEALLYGKNPDKSVDCFLCRHNCHIKDGGRGVCMVRENKDGTLYSLFYGRPVALSVDPIEKKPLFHVYPGSKSFSIATVGCNFQCPFCQNWDISQYGRSQIADSRSPIAGGKLIMPDEIAANALESGCRTIAYTYSEPTVFFEYAYDISKSAEKYDIKNVFVTNGYMTRGMLDKFHPLLHAANIDLKAFNPNTYRTMMKAELGGVLDSIKYMRELGIWVEVTTLIVTGMNDGQDELKQIAGFIAGVGEEIPWHISRFHPAYKVKDKDVTAEETLEQAHEIGKKAGLRYVYTGNVYTPDKENTYCYNCGSLLIERSGFSVVGNKIVDGLKCFKCKSKIDGLF